MPPVVEGTASYHFVRVEKGEDEWVVEGHYPPETVDRYEAPALTINDWDVDLNGVLELSADEDAPEEWILVEASESTVDIRP